MVGVKLSLELNSRHTQEGRSVRNISLNRFIIPKLITCADQTEANMAASLAVRERRVKAEL